MLRKLGQQVTLRRVVGTTNQTNVDCQCWAFVRNYNASELAGSIIQGDSAVILSATDIISAQWPGGQAVTNPPGVSDPRVPRATDRVIIEGRARSIISAEPIYVGGELHRVNLQVRG